VRVATVRRGVDPGGYTLLAFGGATGLHVIAVAAERGIGRIVVPLAASVLSDWGMLNTGLRVELSRSQGQTDSIDTDALQAAFSTMEADGLSRLGWFDAQIMTHRSAAMRNGEPVFEIVVPLDDVDCALGWVVAERFHAVHERLYTYVLRDQQAELVNARLSVIGRLLPVEAQIVEASRTIASPEATRPIYLGGRIRVPVFDFLLLALERTVDGPALIESDTTTIPLRTGETAQFDPRGWLHVAIDGKPSSA
jgi:N-methylhydantoinase A